ncbi:MAG: ComF family protein [Clostridia bacterium]|nr:ComF family protein [Clostridia bacterium]
MSIFQRITDKIIRWLLALFTIPKCAVCRKRTKGRDRLLCRDCDLRFSTERAKSCTSCGYPHPLCICVLEAADDIYRVIHMAPYDPEDYGVSSKAVFMAKDKYIADTFSFMAEQMHSALEMNNVFPQKGWVITWIPRRKRTIRRIGHDQSKVIARKLAHRYGMRLTAVFVNTGDKPQKRQNFSGRVMNAFSSYRVTMRGAGKIFGKTVIIVDDLTTTGASQHVAISLAIEAGATEVIPVTFAKTDRGFIKYKLKKK